MTLAELLDMFNLTKHHGFPVVDEERYLYGMMTLQDVELALNKHLPRDSTVDRIATREDIVAYPDEPMAAALRRMTLRGLGRLPVVSREDPRTLVGIVRRTDILRAYNLALTRRAEVQHRAEQLALRKVDNTTFGELTITQDAPCAGRTVGELAKRLPHEAVLVSIRRKNGQMVIPHGNTVLQPGDTVTAFTDVDSVPALQNCLFGPGGGGVCETSSSSAEAANNAN